MISMGDRDLKGGVNLEDFIVLMRDLGLIPKERKRDTGLLEPGVDPNDPLGLKGAKPNAPIKPIKPKPINIVEPLSP